MFDGGGHTSMVWLKGLRTKILQDCYHRKLRPVKKDFSDVEQHANVPSNFHYISRGCDLFISPYTTNNEAMGWEKGALPQNS